MNYSANPDIEQFQPRRQVVRKRLDEFEGALANYAQCNAILRDLGNEVAAIKGRCPADLRERLVEAAQRNGAAQLEVIAQAKILVGSGALDVCREVLE